MQETTWVPPIDHMSIKELQAENARLREEHERFLRILRAAQYMHDELCYMAASHQLPTSHRITAEKTLAYIRKTFPDAVKAMEDGA